jgi:hypothetical protein
LDPRFKEKHASNTITNFRCQVENWLEAELHLEELQQTPPMRTITREIEADTTSQPPKKKKKYGFLEAFEKAMADGESPRNFS